MDGRALLRAARLLSSAHGISPWRESDRYAMLLQAINMCSDVATFTAARPRCSHRAARATRPGFACGQPLASQTAWMTAPSCVAIGAYPQINAAAPNAGDRHQPQCVAHGIPTPSLFITVCVGMPCATPAVSLPRFDGAVSFAIKIDNGALLSGHARPARADDTDDGSSLQHAAREQGETFVRQLNKGSLRKLASFSPVSSSTASQSSNSEQPSSSSSPAKTAAARPRSSARRGLKSAGARSKPVRRRAGASEDGTRKCLSHCAEMLPAVC